MRKMGFKMDKKKTKQRLLLDKSNINNIIYAV